MAGGSIMTFNRWRTLGIALLCAVTLAVVLAFGVNRLSKSRCFQLTGEFVCSVDTQEPLVALTFDDGPTPEGVDAVLPILEEHGAKATFFLIGNRMEKFPGQAERLLQAGHELGNHSWSHQRNIGKSRAFYREEISGTHDALEQAGATPVWFRPPFGRRLIGLPQEVERAGYRLAMWDVEDRPEDFDGDPQAFADDILDRVRPGSIILMHPMYRHNQTARDALPIVLRGLEERGLRPVTLSELVASGTSIP